MNEEYRQVASGRAQLHIGKQGITPGLVDHLQQIFKHEKLLKIKVMPDTANYVGIEKILTQLITQVPVFVYDVRGFTAIISKRVIPDLHPKKKYLEIRQAHVDPESDKSLDSVDRVAAVASPESTGTVNDPKTTSSPSPSLDEIPDPSELIAEDFEEPAYIDYDNEEMLEEIDKLSDEIYGKPPQKPRFRKRPLKKRSRK